MDAAQRRDIPYGGAQFEPSSMVSPDKKKFLKETIAGL
jgi:anthranilate/para-aminobenzoate synthase component II